MYFGSYILKKNTPVSVVILVCSEHQWFNKNGCQNWMLCNNMPFANNIGCSKSKTSTKKTYLVLWWPVWSVDNGNIVVATCQTVNSFVRFGYWIQGYFRPWQQYCVIAPPQFASPDEVRWVWIFFKTVHHSQVLLSSTLDSVYYFNVIHIYVGCKCQLVL